MANTKPLSINTRLRLIRELNWYDRLYYKITRKRQNEQYVWNLDKIKEDKVDTKYNFFVSSQINL